MVAAVVVVWGRERGEGVECARWEGEKVDMVGVGGWEQRSEVVERWMLERRVERKAVGEMGC